MLRALVGRNWTLHKQVGKIQRELEVIEMLENI